jgi:Leucine-rich repeat (LRR) protein
MSHSDEQSFLEIVAESPVLMKWGSMFGIGLAVVSLGLLVWAENRTIATARGLEEGAGSVVAASASNVDPANEGRLVHVTGEATVGQPLVDPDFGISVPAMKLMRAVEMYQWKEKKNETKKGDKTVVSYSYSKEWSKGKPKQGFEDPKGHENPKELPYKDQDFAAPDARLGAFSLTTSQVAKLKGDVPLPVTREMLENLPANNKKPGSLDSDGKLFVSMTEGSTVQEPAVGDIRVAYSVVPPQTITIVARQKQQTFEPYHSSAGTDFDIVKTGAHDSKAMFASEHGSNQIMGWALRILLLGLVSVSMFLMIRPLAADSGYAMADSTVNIVLALVGTLAALGVIATVVGGRWLVYQPGFGGSLLAGGLAGLAILFLALRRLDKSGTLSATSKFSPEEVAMFRRVALDPDNKSLRLHLADLLAKNGNPLGEFIKVDVELEGMAANDARRTQLDPRWSSLFEAHSRTWFIPLKKLGLEPTIGNTFAPYLWLDRGVIDKCVIDRPGILPEKADRLFEAAPGLNELELHRHRSIMTGNNWKSIPSELDIPAVFALPHLEQIVSLNLTSMSLQPNELEAIARAPHLKNLKTLDVSYNTIGSAGAELIARSSRFGSLTTLRMRSCDIGDAGATALAQSLELTRLTQLDLAGNGLTAEGVRAIASSNSLTGLTELDLEGNEIGIDGAASLASSSTLGKVTTLKLGTTSIGSEGLQALTNSTQLSELKVLVVDSNSLGAPAFRTLSTSSQLPKLEELSIAYNDLGDAGLQALASWPGLAHVRKLNLRSNAITGVGIAAFATSAHLKSLEELDLSNCEAGISGARALAESEPLMQVKSLKIDSGYLTSEGEQLLRNRFGERVECS